jgi:hypothetical protein
MSLGFQHGNKYCGVTVVKAFDFGDIHRKRSIIVLIVIYLTWCLFSSLEFKAIFSNPNIYALPSFRKNKNEALEKPDQAHGIRSLCGFGNELYLLD